MAEDESNKTTTKFTKLSKIDLHQLVLEGKFVRLEPLSFNHVDSLFNHYLETDISHVFTWPRDADKNQFSQFIEHLINSNPAATFAVIHKVMNEPIGSTSFMDIREEHKGLEIGSTWYSTKCQGTQVNPESKLLMLQFAFETWLAERVQLKTDARNARSRAAILKIGAQFEGILRKHILLPDGFVRDTAMYSITKSEWPIVKINLQKRLST